MMSLNNLIVLLVIVIIISFLFGFFLGKLVRKMYTDIDESEEEIKENLWEEKYYPTEEDKKLERQFYEENPHLKPPGLKL